VHQEVFKALQLPRVREAMIAGGYEPDGRSPEEFKKFVRAEFDRYGEMVNVAQVPKE
jgi:tripartite-type tricarboxylate transporter receptor subunit TctC